MSELLAPLCGAILVGVVASALRLFSQDDARLFSRFVFLVGMPIAVLNFMQATEPPTLEFLGMIVAYLIGLAVTAGLAFVIARRGFGLTVREAGAAVFTVTCGNAVFLGLPVALAVPGWGPPFLVLMIFEGAIVFGLGSVLMTWPEEGDAPMGLRRTAGDAVVRIARNPIVIATLIGFAIALSEAELPPLIAQPLSFFGPIASPFGLFVLGLYLVILPRQSASPSARLLGALLPLKLFAFPIVTGSIAWALTRDAVLTSASVFFTCLPPAVSSIILAASYRQLEVQTAGLVAVGTVVGLVTTAGVLFILV